MAPVTTWRLTGQLHGRPVEARWDEPGGLVADPEVGEAVLDLAAAGAWVQAPPSGPAWPAGTADFDAAFFSVSEVLDTVDVVEGGPPGWPWGVPECATDC